jgi:mono/diheme cytochrome c family protein
MSRKYCLGLLVLLSIAGVLLAQEAQKPEEKPATGTAAAQATPMGPHNYNLTPEDMARKSPVAFTEISVARGKKLYQSQCAMCHGQNGDGKGEAVAEMKINPPDFTKPETLKDRTDGALFVILAVGSETMPGQGTRMKDKEKWDLVNYLRAVGGKIPEKSTGKEPEENIILVPQKP